MTSTRDPTIQNFRRYEFKYIVDNSRAELIRQDLLEFLEVDPLLKQSGDKSYTVRSLYFDSPTKEHFFEKIDGLKTRRKYRLRTYASKLSETDIFFLEQKGKQNERTFKHRRSFDISELDKFLVGGDTTWLLDHQLDNQFIEGYIFDTIRRRLQPTVVVEYQRQPYISNHDSYFRVTLDSNLTCFPANDLFLSSENHIKILPGYTVIELKFFRRIPLWFHRIIQTRQLSRVSISKFVAGMKASGLAVDLS